MKRRLITHFKNHWKPQLLGIIISIFLSALIITMASSPNKNEKITMFITCDSLSEGFFDYMDRITPEYLELLDIYKKGKAETYYTTVLTAYKKRADIVIVPESMLGHINKGQYFELSNSFISNFTTNTFEYYYIDSVAYGLKIYSKDTNTGILNGLITFDKDINNDEDYYLFININSHHMGEFNSSKHNGLIDILKEILNYEN